MWSEQQEGPGYVVSGNPNFNNSSAAALLSYDVAHSIPWDWRVSLYTWTKGIASGVYLVARCSCCSVFSAHVITRSGYGRRRLFQARFSHITGGLLLWDLEHPERFYLIFTRPQWRSWLVKGAFIIAGYTLVLALHFIASWAGSRSFQTLADDRWSSVVDPDGSLHGLSFRTGKSARHVAKPAAAAASAFQSLLLGSAVLLPLVVWSEETMTSDVFRLHRYCQSGITLAVVGAGNLRA